jgi:hypothetical protein
VLVDSVTVTCTGFRCPTRSWFGIGVPKPRQANRLGGMALLLQITNI